MGRAPEFQRSRGANSSGLSTKVSGGPKVSGPPSLNLVSYFSTKLMARSQLTHGGCRKKRGGLWMKGPIGAI